MCSESIPNGSYDGTSTSPYITGEVGSVEVLSSKGDDIFWVACLFLEYIKKVSI